MRLAGAAISTAFLAEFTTLVPVFRSDLQAYLGIQDGAFGVLLSVSSLTGIVAVLLGGALVDRWGPGPVVRGCAVGMAAGMAVIAAAGTRFWLVAAGLGLTGLFGRPLAVAVSAYLVGLFPAAQRRLLSVNLAVGALGGVAVPALAEGLLRLWRSSVGFSFGWIFHGPLALAAVLMAAAAVPHRRSADRPGPVGGNLSWRWRDLWLPRSTLALCVLAAVHGAADNTLYLWMARFLGGSAFADRPLAPGLVLSAFSLGYAVSRLALAFVPDGVGRRALLFWPGLLGGVVLLAGLCLRGYAWTATGYIIGGLLWSLEYPAFLSAITLCEPRRCGAALALSHVLSGLLSFVALTAVGMAASRGGDAAMWRVLVSLSALFPCVGLGGALWLRWHGGLLGASRAAMSAGNRASPGAGQSGG